MKRFCSVLVAFALCLGLVQPPRAQAVAAEAGFIGSLIGVVMSSMGYTWTANNMNEQGFGDALEDVIVEYLNTEVGGMTIDEWAMLGTSVALSGNSTLVIQQGLVKKISEFADWFSEKFNLVGGSSVPVYSSSGGVLLADGFVFEFSVWDESSKHSPSHFGSIIDTSPAVYEFSSGASIKVVSESWGTEFYVYRPDGSKFLSSGLAVDGYVFLYVLGSDVYCGKYSPSSNSYTKIPGDAFTSLFVSVPASALDVGKSPVAQNPDIADDGTQAYEVTYPNLTADDLQALITAAVAAALEGTLLAEGTVTDNPAVPDNPADEGIWGAVYTVICNIRDAILGIGTVITDAVVSAMSKVFLPAEEKVLALQQEVDLHFPFIGDLKGFGSDFVDVLNDPGGSAVNLTTIVDLGKKADGTYGGAKINLLDASWYLPYKPIGDDIVVGVCWLVFLWNLYGALPSIIHGGASGLYSMARIDDERRRRFWEDIE